MDDCDDPLAAAHLYNQFKQLNLNNPHAPIGDYKYYSSKNLKMCFMSCLFFLPFAIGIASIDKRPILEVNMVLHSIDIIQDSFVLNIITNLLFPHEMGNKNG